MKHLYMKEQTQQPKNIQDVFTEHQKFNLITNRMKSSIASTGDREKGNAIERNIFLTQNKGKGPPGRQRSPVETKPDRFRKPVRFDQTIDSNSTILSLNSKFMYSDTGATTFEIVTNSENDDYKKYKFNFIQILNSMTMKKQILFLVLAVFASVTVAWGQNATHNSNSTPVNCASDALNPIPGKEYSYSAAVSVVPGTAKWHVVAGTPTQQFITNGAWAATDETTAGSYILSSNPDPIASLAVAASPATVSLTWESAGLAQVIADPTNRKLFVAIEYEGTANCTNNNLQVWEINPKNAFTLDVFNITSAGALTGSGSTVSQCYSDIASASYTSGSPGTVTMDYGTNTITYEIVAANFTGSFSSTVQLSGLQGAQQADISWGYTIATAGANVLATGAANGTYGPIVATIANGTDTGLGVSVFVQVVVHNRGYEGLSNDGITLAADAVDSAGQNDVEITNCTPETAYADQATHTLSSRPTINNPAPTPFLNKN